jgi:hypothetical protein
MMKIICYSCTSSKSKINAVDSRLLNGIKLLMCSTCIDKNYEPRWAIVISARHGGSEKIKDYVLNKRYIGEDIVASELLI